MPDHLRFLLIERNLISKHECYKQVFWSFSRSTDISLLSTTNLFASGQLTSMVSLQLAAVSRVSYRENTSG